MNRRGRILLPFLFILTCFPALSATAPNVKSVQHIYDAQILTAIKASGQIVKLRKTRLKDIAPQFWVEAAPKLSWTEALQVASLRFKDNPTKRVLFLAAYLKKDDPASRISEMQIQVPIAKELFTNNYSDPYELKEKPAVGKSPTSIIL